MELIQNNPYRIAGILSNATERELQKQKAKIKAYSKVGKEIKSDYDFQILENITRTVNSIDKAFSDVEQNQDKVNFSLFWFLNASPYDKTAIENLKNGNAEKAIEIWKKVTLNKEVNSKNFSAFSNLGTYKLLSKSKEGIKEGIEAKIKLIESEYFENFVRYVADETITINNEKQIEKLVEELLTQFKKQYSSNEILKLFSNCNISIQKYLSNKFTEEPIHNIESQIESSKKNRKEKKNSAYEFGLKLYKNTKDDLSLLKSLLNSNDLKYKSVADQLANEIMQCGIDYFNDSKDNESSDNYIESTKKLTKIADIIAIGKLTKDRAKDSLITLEEMKDEGLSQIVDVLQSIKETYENHEKNIKKQIEELKESDVEIRLGYKSINQSAVEENIKNSIDWKKVNELLKTALTNKSLSNIKASKNNQLKTDFLELAHWLKSYSQSSSVITKIIDTYKKIPPKLTFKVLSSKITNTEDKPLFTKFVRYIGLNLNIQVTENNSVTFYIKYINPTGRMRGNTKTAPRGYTRSETKRLNTSSNSIKFSGWGNEDKCIYAIGEHRIELYVDEYLVHTKKYVIDLAPSEKIQKEIASANKKLRAIIKTDYFVSEINSAINEMSEIQKFKFFRGSSEKKNQVQSQQIQIDQLIQKSKDEKRKNIKRKEEQIYKLKMELSVAKY
jgi:hypothetical protein